MSIQNMKTRRIKCARCDKVLPKDGPRLVIGGAWVCSDCAYEHDYGTKGEKPKRGKAGPPQDEQLFP